MTPFQLSSLSLFSLIWCGQPLCHVFHFYFFFQLFLAVAYAIFKLSFGWLPVGHGRHLSYLTAPKLLAVWVPENTDKHLREEIPWCHNPEHHCVDSLYPI